MTYYKTDKLVFGLDKSPPRLGEGQKPMNLGRHNLWDFVLY
jgi:hypothetical protein